MFIFHDDAPQIINLDNCVHVNMRGIENPNDPEDVDFNELYVVTNQGAEIIFDRGHLDEIGAALFRIADSIRNGKEICYYSGDQ